MPMTRPRKSSQRSSSKTFSSQDGQELIRIARDAISSSFTHTPLTLDQYLQDRFSERQGGFVTLTKQGNLRGCIGYTEPIFPLHETIRRAARAAAFDDTRFPPLTEEEFKSVKVEVSVLSVPEKVQGPPSLYPKQFSIGTHGLIIKRGMFQGLLLPQVFTEYQASPEQALAMTCQKAGLPEDAWQQEETELYTFSAQIFTEK
ncbi:MAG: AmmeMemoRadiSam system protein A [DPANN group archaeon]|nr:AmmeMemoRadiSam system protein A [DPANN group archaeon]